MTEPLQATRAESPEEIEARAADFLHRRRVHRWSDADRAELDAWLEESTAHRVAFLRLEEGEALVERIADLDTDDIDRLRGRRRRHAMPFLAIAASLGLIAVFGVAAERYLQQPPPDRSYSTEVGGKALLGFADRTQIELNTDTAVRFRITGEERTVWLDRGEAWFRVSHDASRPFTVFVGNHRVTDLGTEFLIRKDPGRFEVALLKGRAQLSTGGDRPQFATLTPGDEAVATLLSVSFTRKTPEQLSDELAWQRGVIVFRNTRLADAVREFNRYNETKLVIADPSIADVKFSAAVKTENFEDFVHIAQAVLNLHVEREGNAILISRVSKKLKRAAP